jgi:hypothetical protein
MGNSDFMEAVGDGIRPMPYVRILTRNPKRWSLLRLESDLQAAAAAAKHVRAHSFKGYNLSGALTTFLPKKAAARSAQLFCSQLVAAAYKSAGIDLCPAKQPAQITPADLEKRSLLREAPNPFVEIADPEERKVLAQFLDRDAAYKSSSLDAERKASQEAFRAVRKLARKSPTPTDNRLSFPPGNLGELIELLANENSPEGDVCADRLLAELGARDYFNLLVPMVAELTAYLQSQLAILDYGAHSAEVKAAVTSRLDEIASGWSDTERRYRLNYAACMSGFQRNRRPLLMKLAAMYMVNADAFDYLRNVLQQSPAYSAHCASMNPARSPNSP